MTTDDFNRLFRYHRGGLLEPWRDLRDYPRGDCQSYAWTVLLIETGSPANALLAMLTLRAMIWRAQSPVNGIIPRHAVLYLRGKGWIDSTNREWRDSPRPHRLRWPAGAPVVAALAMAWGWM